MYGEGAVTGQVCQKWFVKFLVLLTLWPNDSFPWGCLTYWKVFSSSPGLYPLEANSGRQPTYSKYPDQWSYWWKWKMCLLFYGKNKTMLDILANPIINATKGKKNWPKMLHHQTLAFWWWVHNSIYSFHQSFPKTLNLFEPLFSHLKIKIILTLLGH